EAILKQCQEYLLPFTNAVAEAKRARIEHYVESDAPEYRPILRHIEREIEALDPEIGDAQLDLKLYEAYHSLQVRMRAEGSDLLSSSVGEGDEFEAFEERLQSYFELVSDVNSSDLARYVCHRRAILDFLQTLLRRHS
ncbi:hypothetical protein ACFLS0_06820, partial [Candidatus Bipolaricaulota bacterium]